MSRHPFISFFCSFFLFFSLKSGIIILNFYPIFPKKAPLFFRGAFAARFIRCRRPWLSQLS